MSATAFPVRTDRPLVLAHRGASADAPENTLAAFREAVRQGADGVELDVMPCRTGELVVCHDAWLDRLAGRHAEVLGLSLAELRKLDVGRRFGEAFAGEAVPTLQEVFELLPAGMVVNVELKCDTVRDHGLAQKAARELARFGARHRVVVSSFNPGVLARFRAFAPRAPTGLLFEREQSLLLRDGLLAPLLATASVHPEHAFCTPDRVARWHEAGYAVATWTVDAPGDVARCAAAGVDALITNRPAATLRELARHPFASHFG